MRDLGKARQGDELMSATFNAMFLRPGHQRWIDPIKRGKIWVSILLVLRRYHVGLWVGLRLNCRIARLSVPIGPLYLHKLLN